MSTKNEYSRVVCHNGSTATATGNDIGVLGFDHLAVQVSGTFTATATFEGTIDGTNWASVGLVDFEDRSTISPTATAAGIFYAQVSGMERFRARLSGYSDGSVTVVAIAQAS